MRHRVPLVLLCCLVLSCTASPSAPPSESATAAAAGTDSGFGTDSGSGSGSGSGSDTDSGSDTGPRWTEDVERLARPLIDGQVVPGLVIGLFDDGRPEVHAFGRIDLDGPRPPDGRTVYEIGSISKVFTALLLADAVRRGEVELDTPLGDLLPDTVRAPRSGDTEITLTHLATHRSGLPRLPDNMPTIDLRDPYVDYDVALLHAFLDTHELAREPGEAYAYSNLGVGLLGQLLADVAGTTYPELLGARIARPLGLADTTVELDADGRARFAPPTRDGRAVHPWHFDALCGAGGIRSTVDDMLRFVEAALDPGSNPLRETFETAAEPRTENTALGWHLAGDGHTLWHNGETGGYSSALFVSPKFGKGVVVLANGAASQVTVLGERLIQLLFGFTVDPPDVRVPADVPEEDLLRLAGTYRAERGPALEITVDGGAVLAQLAGQPQWRVWPLSPTRFFYRVVEAELEFATGESGSEVSGVTLFQGGRELRFDRVER